MFMADLVSVSDAVISDNGLYRYQLRRGWDSAKPWLDWIMLNPSTADGTKDDATIRRATRFARGWGYGGIEVYNLFAYRATDPEELKIAIDPVGPKNDYFLSMLTGDIVLAWGSTGGRFPSRVREVTLQLRRSIPIKLYCLGKTKNGEPLHPLRLSAFTKLKEWRP